MAAFKASLVTDLKKPLQVIPLEGVLFTGDEEGNVIEVTVLDGGEAAVLSGTVTAYMIRPDGCTLTQTGTLSGNTVTVVLPAGAYALEGALDIAIRLTNGDTKTVLGACRAHILRSSTDSFYDPGHVVPSLDDLLAQIDACEEATDAAEAAAASLENMDATATTLAAGESATAAVSTVSGHYRLALGIPRGQNAAVSSTAVTYQNSQSAVEVPTGTWETTQPVTPQGQYLWVRTVLTWNNGGTTTLYSVSRMGVDGSGSVSSVNNISPDGSGNVTLPVDTEPEEDGANPITSGGVYEALGDRAVLTWDTAPTSGSVNPVTSGGIHTALVGKIDRTGDSMSGPLNMDNGNIQIQKANDYPTLRIMAYNASSHDNFPSVMIQPNVRSSTEAFFSFFQSVNGNAWERFNLPATSTSTQSGTSTILTTRDFNAPEDFTTNSSAIEYSVAGYAKKCTRQGRVCTIEYMSDSVAAANWTQDKVLFTLKTGYRPTVNTFFMGAIGAAPIPALFRMGTDGEVRFYSANGTLSGNPRVYLNFSYSCV